MALALESGSEPRVKNLGKPVLIFFVLTKKTALQKAN
jgi:hypothetical protein